MLLLAGSHHNLYLKNIRIVEIILELLLPLIAPTTPPPPLIISRLVWLIEQLGEHGRGQRGACDLNIRGVGLLTLQHWAGCRHWSRCYITARVPITDTSTWHLSLQITPWPSTLYTLNSKIYILFSNNPKRVIFINCNRWTTILVPDPIQQHRFKASMKCPPPARLIYFLLNVDTL